MIKTTTISAIESGIDDRPVVDDWTSVVSGETTVSESVIDTDAVEVSPVKTLTNGETTAISVANAQVPCSSAAMVMMTVTTVEVPLGE